MELIGEILDLQTSYSPTKNAKMTQRQLAVKNLAERLREIIPKGRKVDYGGQVGSFAPIPWVRIYSELHSPKATSGYYIVLLFSADGTHAYLSINQGTSEFRSGNMRNINDSVLIRSKSNEARRRLANKLFGLKLEIDLGLNAQHVQNSAYSKTKIKNYELGHVAGVEFRRNKIPPEGNLLMLIEMLLPLLEILESSTEPKVNQKTNNNSYDKSKIEALLKSLEQYTGNDNPTPDNYTALPFSTAELDILRHSLTIASTAADLPNWANETIFFLKGVLAVLKKLKEFVPKPLTKSWNSAIKGLQDALDSLRTDNED